METKVLQSLLSINSSEIDLLNLMNKQLTELARDPKCSKMDYLLRMKIIEKNKLRIVKLSIIQKSAKKELAGMVRSRRQVRNFLGL